MRKIYFLKKTFFSDFKEMGRKSKMAVEITHKKNAQLWGQFFPKMGFHFFAASVLEQHEIIRTFLDS